ncbi:hypothetical protein [Bradyrhizobium australafricanum]|uniref:hypothetical protein n=1 Tax=Bradyrhizobium australafricanum TaxID=2821406 RepID=UPI001CE2A9ED|nr:hypothetical protein [Bradyrhizobium australafricanum]MCA6103938.1 hypothetical protein [Bradyrhizobium australafricanum]
MVRAGNSAPMLIVEQDGGTATCVFVDSNGSIRKRSCFLDQLTPLWLSLSPKTTWPDTSQIDQISIEKEEREAAAARKVARQAARKARRSNRIKRGRDAA